ncbi:MAG: hypothetical protein Q8O19_01275 [Rectinemataceae bacterium]|nr:hypothetical protein [Rectinemataceae bacterium]
MDRVFKECPISSFDPDAAELLSVVDSCEGGMGGRRSPADVLSDTNYYYNVRTIVMSERGRIERWKKKKEDKKGRRK